MEHDDRQRHRIWAVSIALTLVLHVAIAIGARALNPFQPDPTEPQPPEVVRMVFDRPTPEPEDEPRVFSELPPDRADTPPEKAELLSNVDSRARDDADGEKTSDLPRLEGSSEAPHVPLHPGAAQPAPGEPEQQPADPPHP
ncbi:MAG: hypothetical protein GF355_11285, partial [Candidatus Eisenbacteria bacterium]|nr:hypothetical protein [Candidatus Eisenbacteria bacterium]